MKAYASQESIAETLTAAERAAPFQETAPDDEPLPKVTREAIVVIDSLAMVAVLVERENGERRLVIRERLA
jgi:hypothetical protein